MNPNDQKAFDDIEKFGCHILHVLGEGEFPPFSYSIGIKKTSGKPEVVVVGLKQPIAHQLINDYNSRVRAGEDFRLASFTRISLKGLIAPLKESILSTSKNISAGLSGFTKTRRLMFFNSFTQAWVASGQVPPVPQKGS